MKNARMKMNWKNDIIRMKCKKTGGEVMRTTGMIAGAVIIGTLAAVAGFAFVLYKVGEDMSMYRCGCGQQDRGF